ncbi:hypothetical protein [Streptomyces lydicus]
MTEANVLTRQQVTEADLTAMVKTPPAPDIDTVHVTPARSSALFRTTRR